MCKNVRSLSRLLQKPAKFGIEEDEENSSETNDLGYMGLLEGHPWFRFDQWSDRRIPPRILPNGEDNEEEESAVKTKWSDFYFRHPWSRFDHWLDISIPRILPLESEDEMTVQ